MIRIPEAVEMNGVAGPGAEGDGGAGPVTTSRPSDPDPEVPATVQRRRFSPEYRLRILTQADACKKPGEVGALLRREGLYSSLLTNWRGRCARCAGAVGGRRPAPLTRA